MKKIEPINPEQLLTEAEERFKNPYSVLGLLIRRTVNKQNELIEAHNELVAKYEEHWHSPRVDGHTTAPRNDEPVEQS